MATIIGIANSAFAISKEQTGIIIDDVTQSFDKEPTASTNRADRRHKSKVIKKLCRKYEKIRSRHNFAKRFYTEGGIFYSDREFRVKFSMGSVLFM